MKRKFYVKPSLVLVHTEVQPLMSTSFKTSSTETVGKTDYDWERQTEGGGNTEEVGKEDFEW